MEVTGLRVRERTSAPTARTARGGSTRAAPRLGANLHSQRRIGKTRESKLSEDVDLDLESEEKSREAQELRDGEAKVADVRRLRVRRARAWSEQVEDNHRLQVVGWKDLHEYRSQYGEPQRWPSGFLKCLRVKKTGFFTYWSKSRECPDSALGGVKLFDYDA